MPPPDLSEVVRGLAFVHWGFRLVAGAVGVACAGVVLAAVTDVRYHTSAMEFLLFAIAVLASCTVVVGVLVGFSGRERCLETPPELPIARARVQLAVLLEGCGWLSGLVNTGVAWANAVGSITVPWEVLYAVFGFAFVLFLAGRVFFFAYIRSLARSVDFTAQADSPLLAIMVVVTTSTVVATSVGLLVTSDDHGTLTPDRMAAMGGTFLGALGTLTGLHFYGRMLRRLREGVSLHDSLLPERNEV